MQSLQTVSQHRAIGLYHQIVSDLDPVVRCDAEEHPVEGGVVQLAEREAVADHGIATGLGVGNDVGSVEELAVA